MVVRRREGVEHAKVLDFGLAKLRERGATERAISSGGQVIGTPDDMAPEQVRGEDLDARADIYSLGATLYRVLTGEPPFDAPSPMSVLSKHLTDDVVPPRDRAPTRALPPDADRIVLRAMAKSADDRYASAAEVQQDLERARILGRRRTILRRDGGAATSIPGGAGGGRGADAGVRRCGPPRVDDDRARAGRSRCGGRVATGRGAGPRRDLERRRRDGPSAPRRRRRLRMVAAPPAVAAAARASCRRTARRGRRRVRADQAAVGAPGRPRARTEQHTGVRQPAPARRRARGRSARRSTIAKATSTTSACPPGTDRARYTRAWKVSRVDLVLELFDAQGAT